MAKIELKNPVANKTPNGAFVIGGKYIIGKPQAKMVNLIHVSQLAGQTITLEVPDNPREYDETRELNDQDITRTGLLRADLVGFKANLDRLAMSAEVSKFSKIFNEEESSELAIRKLRNEISPRNNAAPVTSRPRTIVDPLDNTEEDGNVAADDDDDDAAAAELAALQAKADAKAGA